MHDEAMKAGGGPSLGMTHPVPPSDRPGACQTLSPTTCLSQHEPSWELSAVLCRSPGSTLLSWEGIREAWRA